MKISRKRWKWDFFGIFLVIGFALTAWAVVSLFTWAGCDRPEPSKNTPTETVRRPVTFGSPTEYDGPGGVYRWRVKTDPEMPNDNASEHYKVKLTDIINWPEPSTIIHTDSDRWGIENDFYTVDADLMDLKIEPDGDMHLLMGNYGTVQVVCEVPAGKPWDAIRTEIFSWTDVKFPFTITSTRTIAKALSYKRLRLTGKAFWDGEHKGKIPNRRSYDKNIAVWELHPVMTMEVLNK